MTRWTWLVLAMIVAVHARVAAAFGFVCDDAWISFRYARHLAEGRGLTFNAAPPGSVAEAPVEGFSNLLWVLGAAAFEAAGVSPAVGMVAVSVGCAAALLVLQARLAAALGLGPAATAVAVGLLAASPGFVIWSTSGLETMAAALAMTALLGAWVVVDRPWAGVVAAAALIGLRTEGIGWVLVVGLLGLWVRPRRVGPALGVSFALWAALAAWRYSYFGGVVSNTAVAKVGFDADRILRGGQYVLGFWVAAIAPGALLLLTPAALWRGRAWAAVAVLAWGPPAFAVLIGGDFMTMGRMLVAGLPMAALAAAGLVEWTSGWRRGVAIVGLVAVGALGTLPLLDVQLAPNSVRRSLDVRENTSAYRSELEQWRFMKGNAKRWAQLGHALSQVEAPGESIVLGAVGAVGYFCELQVFDRYGLVSPDVARRDGGSIKGHSPGHDKEVPVTYFLDREPTFLHAELVKGSRPLGDLRRQMADWVDSAEVRAGWGPVRYDVKVGAKAYTLLVLRRLDDPAAAWRSLTTPAPVP
jgi:arabinofuranosyltransferase